MNTRLYWLKTTDGMFSVELGITNLSSLLQEVSSLRLSFIEATEYSTGTQVLLNLRYVTEIRQG